MTARPSNKSGLWRIFRWPLALAIVSLIGLVAALVGDAVYDYISWIALGAIPTIIAAAWWGWRAH